MTHNGSALTAAALYCPLVAFGAVETATAALSSVADCSLAARIARARIELET